MTSFLSLLVPTPPSPKRTLLSKSSSILVQGAEVLGNGARRPCPRSEGDLDGDAGQHEGEEACGTRKLGGQGPEFAALEAGPSAAQHRIVRHGARLLSHIFETRPVCVVTQPGLPVGHRSRGARLGQPQPSQALLAVVATNPQRTPRRADTGPSASSSSSVASSTTYEVAFVAPSSTPCGLTPSRPSWRPFLCLIWRKSLGSSGHRAWQVVLALGGLLLEALV